MSALCGTNKVILNLNLNLNQSIKKTDETKQVPLELTSSLSADHMKFYYSVDKVCKEPFFLAGKEKQSSQIT